MYFKFINSYFSILYVAFIQDWFEDTSSIYSNCIQQYTDSTDLKTCMGKTKF